MSIYKPTWLMIKKHNQTGLKYFCKTIKSDPYRYNGSGTYWQNHLRVHGKDISTTWCHLYENREDLINYAITFSIENDIVKSDEWANLAIENGIDGGPRINNHLLLWNKLKLPKTATFKKSITAANQRSAKRAIPVVVNDKHFQSIVLAARYFNVTEMTIYNWIKAGKANKQS